ncbi:MAG: hypothetical protein QF551_09220 [Candidatus Marinimicrobia bacterium]|jgi:hypothetical protein|nr:hypothetical protein [Candidatus Neomarinimicrobiota bacterium]|tara:strand:+ start:35901 stop:36830 length:930 start_codon:yes stop_codon:yes gene_type:complete
MLIRFLSFRYIVAAQMAALALLPHWLTAQGSYSSLEVPYHVRSVSMGGIGIADRGGTDMAAFNPALLQGNTKELLLSVLRYPAQIQSEMVEFRFPWRERSVAVTVRHMGYGSFEALDEDGVKTGEFAAGDIWASLAFSQSIFPSMDFGLTAGIYHSQIEKVRASLGIISVGTVLRLPELDASLGLSVRNLGVTLQNYGSYPETIPTSVNLGATKKLAHLPLELSVDGIWWEQGGVARIGGEFVLKHGILLRWGSSTYRFQQQTEHLWRDILSGSSIGLGYVAQDLTVDIGLGYSGIGGAVIGVGVATVL